MEILFFKKLSIMGANNLMTNIALISDIHFGKFSRTNEFSVPGEPIQDENKGSISLKDSLISVLIDNHVQYLFVAGDLTSLGSPHEFYYCQKEIITIAEKAKIPKNNIIIGLGNHDIDWKISKLCEEYSKLDGTVFPFDLVKEKYQLIAARASMHNMPEILQPNNVGPAPYSGIIENDNFVSFVLNSGWFCTYNDKYPHGKLSQDQLDWFQSSAKKFKDDNRWKIVLMHHHPFNYPFPTLESDISTLEEGSKFLEIAGENGINLVLHGHRHHPKAKTIIETGWLAPITFICAGSLSVNSHHRSFGQIPNVFHIVNLLDTPGDLILKNFQYTSADGWIPLDKNQSATPIDPIMCLGKVFNIREINDALLKLEQNKILKWDELPEPLRFLNYNELNSKIRAFYSNTHCVIGEFPKNVYITREG